MSSGDEKGDGSMADEGWAPIKDRSPGTLVWVRRRNGSWWPGRILCKEEMPAKLRRPQRSGIPIKLLGREDGNIDWYNLDKSRRVKPFRCGEYDECIEKAKIHGSQKHIKKYLNQGKYVRREDAILHALEIERNAVCKAAANPPTSSAGQRQINGVKKKPSSETYKNASGERRYASKKRVKNPNDSEEDVKTEGMLRMRDLTEIWSEKEKSSEKKSESQEPALVNPNLVNNMNFQFGGVGSFGISTSLTAKKKRSNMAQAYENMRKKQKSVTLSKICDGTRVIIPSYCDWVGPKASNKDYPIDMGINNKGPDSSDTSSHSTCNGRDSESGGVLGAVLENAASDGFVDVPLVMGDFYNGDLAPFSSYTSDKAGTSMGEWKSTDSNHRTSNSQYNNLTSTGTLGTTEQPHEDGDAINIPSPESTASETSKSMDAKTDVHPDSDYTIPEMEVVNSGCNDDAVSLVDSPVSDGPQYEMVKPLESISKEPTLYEVEMQVEASYKGPRVPLVSLMSKLNGKAIVGHPILVKVLKDGSTLPLVSRREHHRPSTSSISQLLKRGEKVTSGQRKGASHKSSKTWKKMVAGDNSNGNNANKKAGFSPRKMRRLSSITIDHRVRGERKLLVEKVGGPRVACVPLRLVFSRINEALKFSSRLENP